MSLEDQVIKYVADTVVGFHLGAIRGFQMGKFDKLFEQKDVKIDRKDFIGSFAYYAFITDFANQYCNDTD